jgi:hypothetical protein
MASVAVGVRLRRAALIDLQEMFGAGADAWAHPHQNDESEQVLICDAGIREPKNGSCWSEALGAFVKEQVFSQQEESFLLTKKSIEMLALYTLTTLCTYWLFTVFNRNQ